MSVPKSSKWKKTIPAAKFHELFGGQSLWGSMGVKPPESRSKAEEKKYEVKGSFGDPLTKFGIYKTARNKGVVCEDPKGLEAYIREQTLITSPSLCPDYYGFCNAATSKRKVAGLRTIDKEEYEEILANKSQAVLPTGDVFDCSAHVKLGGVLFAVVLRNGDEKPVILYGSLGLDLILLVRNNMGKTKPFTGCFSLTLYGSCLVAVGEWEDIKACANGLSNSSRAILPDLNNLSFKDPDLKGLSMKIIRLVQIFSIGTAFKLQRKRVRNNIFYTCLLMLGVGQAKKLKLNFDECKETTKQCLRHVIDDDDVPQNFIKPLIRAAEFSFIVGPKPNVTQAPYEISVSDSPYRPDSASILLGVQKAHVTGGRREDPQEVLEERREFLPVADDFTKLYAGPRRMFQQMNKPENMLFWPRFNMPSINSAASSFSTKSVGILPLIFSQILVDIDDHRYDLLLGKEFYKKSEFLSNVINKRVRFDLSFDVKLILEHEWVLLQLIHAYIVVHWKEYADHLPSCEGKDCVCNPFPGAYAEMQKSSDLKARQVGMSHPLINLVLTCMSPMLTHIMKQNGISPSLSGQDSEAIYKPTVLHDAKKAFLWLYDSTHSTDIKKFLTLRNSCSLFKELDSMVFLDDLHKQAFDIVIACIQLPKLMLPSREYGFLNVSNVSEEQKIQDAKAVVNDNSISTRGYPLSVHAVIMAQPLLGEDKIPLLGRLLLTRPKVHLLYSILEGRDQTKLTPFFRPMFQEIIKGGNFLLHAPMSSGKSMFANVFLPFCLQDVYMCNSIRANAETAEQSTLDQCLWLKDKGLGKNPLLIENDGPPRLNLNTKRLFKTGVNEGVEKSKAAFFSCMSFHAINVAKRATSPCLLVFDEVAKPDANRTRALLNARKNPNVSVLLMSGTMSNCDHLVSQGFKDLTPKFDMPPNKDPEEETQTYETIFTRLKEIHLLLTTRKGFEGSYSVVYYAPSIPMVSEVAEQLRQLGIYDRVLEVTGQTREKLQEAVSPFKGISAIVGNEVILAGHNFYKCSISCIETSRQVYSDLSSNGGKSMTYGSILPSQLEQGLKRSGRKESDPGSYQITVKRGNYILEQCKDMETSITVDLFSSFHSSKTDVSELCYLGVENPVGSLNDQVLGTMLGRTACMPVKGMPTSGEFVNSVLSYYPLHQKDPLKAISAVRTLQVAFYIDSGTSRFNSNLDEEVVSFYKTHSKHKIKTVVNDGVSSSKIMSTRELDGSLQPAYWIQQTIFLAGHDKQSRSLLIDKMELLCNQLSTTEGIKHDAFKILYQHCYGDYGEIEYHPLLARGKPLSIFKVVSKGVGSLVFFDLDIPIPHEFPIGAYGVSPNYLFSTLGNGPPRLTVGMTCLISIPEDSIATKDVLFVIEAAKTQISEPMTLLCSSPNARSAHLDKVGPFGASHILTYNKGALFSEGKNLSQILKTTRNYNARVSLLYLEKGILCRPFQDLGNKISMFILNLHNWMCTDKEVMMTAIKSYLPDFQESKKYWLSEPFSDPCQNFPKKAIAILDKPIKELLYNVGKGEIKALSFGDDRYAATQEEDCILVSRFVGHLVDLPEHQGEMDKSNAVVVFENGEQVSDVNVTFTSRYYHPHVTVNKQANTITITLKDAKVCRNGALSHAAGRSFNSLICGDSEALGPQAIKSLSEFSKDVIGVGDVTSQVASLDAKARLYQRLGVLGRKRFDNACLPIEDRHSKEACLCAISQVCQGNEELLSQIQTKSKGESTPKGFLKITKRSGEKTFDVDPGLFGATSSQEAEDEFRFCTNRIGKASNYLFPNAPPSQRAKDITEVLKSLEEETVDVIVGEQLASEFCKQVRENDPLPAFHQDDKGVQAPRILEAMFQGLV